MFYREPYNTYKLYTFVCRETVGGGKICWVGGRCHRLAPAHGASECSFLERFDVSSDQLGPLVICWWYRGLYFGLSPLPVTVTTRIITFSVGNPNLNLHLPLASWEGGQPKLYYPVNYGDSKPLSGTQFLNPTRISMESQASSEPKGWESKSSPPRFLNNPLE